MGSAKIVARSEPHTETRSAFAKDFIRTHTHTPAHAHSRLDGPEPESSVVERIRCQKIQTKSAARIVQRKLRDQNLYSISCQ